MPDLTPYESLASNVDSATVGTIKIFINNFEVTQGDVERVPLSTRNAEGINVLGFQLFAQYPKNLVQFKPELTEPSAVFAQAPGLNLLSNVVNINAEQDAIGVSVLVEGEVTITAGEGHLCDVFVEDAPASAVGATGTVVFRGPTPPNNSIIVGSDLTPLDLDIAAPAIFEISGTTYFLLGDVDDSENIDIVDAVLVQRFFSKKIALNEKQQLAADVNRDGLIDGADVSMIQRIALGLSPNPNLAGKDADYAQKLAKGPQQYAIVMNTVAGQEGEVVPLPVFLTDLDLTSGGSFQVNYDPSYLDPVAVNLTPLTEDYLLEWNERTVGRNGILRVTLSAEENAEAGPGNIFIMDFKIVGSGSVSSSTEEVSTPVVVADAKLNRQFGEDVRWSANVNLINGGVNVSPRNLDETGDMALDFHDLLSLSLKWQQRYRGRGPDDVLDFIGLAK